MQVAEPITAVIVKRQGMHGPVSTSSQSPINLNTNVLGLWEEGEL